MSTPPPPSVPIFVFDSPGSKRKLLHLGSASKKAEGLCDDNDYSDICFTTQS
jgi:hypothetical protein